MPVKKAPKAIITKTGVEITTCYCRKCMKTLPGTEFYDSVDKSRIDSNGKFSVCKDCIQKIYSELYDETQSIEKALHSLCIMMNVKYSNEAAAATKTNIETLMTGGKNINSVFGIYKSRLISVNPSMDKSTVEDLTYRDVGTIFTTEVINTKEIPIPMEVIVFWGKDIPRKDIEFLEGEYTNFKNSHKADTYAEIVLLKQICYTLLSIKNLRANNDDTGDAVKELQALMKTVAVSPNSLSAGVANKGAETFGLWIQDIEREEPAQWLKSDPRGEIYRDVGDVEEYFQKYIVRPLKNFIMSSKDFNVDDNDIDDGEITSDFFVSEAKE
jgi:hypothetical protein